MKYGKHILNMETLISTREERHRMILERAPWIAENNWILPLEGEGVSEQYFIRNLGMLEKIRMQKAHTFNEMQRNFWLDRFSQLGYREALLECKALGLSCKGKHFVLVGRLVEYFTNAVSEARA